MRTVTFGAPEGARDPLCDERDVMRKFHSHVNRCDTCYENLIQSRSANRPLCSRGHGYVIDMKPYFFCKGGKVYSMIDREKHNEKTRVMVPVEYRYVSDLFKALGEGYNTTSRSEPRPKVVIHQPRVEERRRRPEPIIPQEYIVAAPRSPRSPRDREERYHREPRRGSLYHHEDQHRRYHRDAEIAVASPTRYYR